jgi:hypothetical protein
VLRDQATKKIGLFGAGVLRLLPEKCRSSIAKAGAGTRRKTVSRLKMGFGRAMPALNKGTWDGDSIIQREEGKEALMDFQR